MYEEFFGFREPPFRITPDPRFLYRNPCVEEAAAALAYGIERRKGFLSLVGDAGTGKTTLLRHVLDTLSGNVRTVLLLHPTVGFDEILEYILSELGIPVEGARKLVLLQRLNEFLLEHTRAGGNVALLIDEAQDLEPQVLEELRLLSNLETGTEKILQIVLAGQPELEAKLGDPGLRQLRQRIALHVRLRPLSTEEVGAYIRTRLEHAGSTRPDVFTPEAIARLAVASQGIPRILNVLCDACLVTAFATGSLQVTPVIVEESSADYGRLVTIDPVPALPARQPPPPAAEPARAPAAPPPAIASPPAAAPVAVEPPAPSMVAALRHVPEPPPAPEPVPPSPPEREPGPWSPRRITALLAASIVAVLGIQIVWNTRHAKVVPPPAVTDTAPPTMAEAPVGAVAPTMPEARALVHEFMLAYEARDADRLVRLFAPDARQNDRDGLQAIAGDYAKTFARLADVTYTVPAIVVTARGDRLALSGPFVITYRDTAGTSGEQRGRAEWEIARHDGRPRIVGLRYSFDG